MRYNIDKFVFSSEQFGIYKLSPPLFKKPQITFEKLFLIHVFNIMVNI